MTLRARILATGALLVLAPLLPLGVGIRWEMSRRLTEQYSQRVDALVAGVAEDLRGRSAALGDRLEALEVDLSRRNDLRLALSGQTEERAALLDWAPGAMALAGLDALQLQDEEGTILSSGQFRNDYDRVDAATPAFLLSQGESAAVVSFRRPQGSFLALSRAAPLEVGGRELVLVAGFELDEAALASMTADRDLTVSLVHGGGVVSADDELVSRLLREGGGALRTMRDSGSHLVRELPLAAPSALRPPGRDAALFLVTHSLAPRQALLRRLDLTLALAWILAAGGTLLLAMRLSRSLARPLEELAERTAEIDLERPETNFATDRTDEVGALSRFLAGMTTRLRTSATQLRDAERRATFGELARQVNHDLKNAFTPLRNVVRHLSEVSESHPGDLPRVYGERRATLDAGLAYLEDLATSWGRLSARPERGPCDVASVVRAVTAGRLEADGGPIRVEVAADAPRAWATAVGLRRIVENLVANACDSLEDERARVTVSVDGMDTASGPAVRLVVADEGPGIPPAGRQRIFEAFYTTKPNGSGLGLSIVHRLVADFEGTLQLESEVGQGTRFIVTLPAGARGPRTPAPPPPLPRASGAGDRS